MSKKNYNGIVLASFKGESHDISLIKIIKDISKEKVCYISINKGADAIIEILKKNKINTNNFFFIDCVTKTIFDIKDKSNCIYLPSPNSLTYISLAIQSSNNKFKYFILDSLSTLLIYHDPNTLGHFVHSIVNQFRIKKDNSIIFLISEKDLKSKLFTKIEPFFDRIINK